MVEIIYKDEAYAIVGACFEVYNEKGCGFLEAVYQESALCANALLLDLDSRSS